MVIVLVIYRITALVSSGIVEQIICGVLNTYDPVCPIGIKTYYVCQLEAQHL